MCALLFPSAAVVGPPFGLTCLDRLCGAVRPQPPFYCRDHKALFDKIRRGRLEYPEHLSADAKSLLSGLLTRDPVHRLGCGASDAVEVKSHPFFKDVDWNALMALQVPAPWRPAVAHSLDTSQFDQEFTSMPLVSPSSREPVGSQVARVKFEGFTYVPDSPMAPGAAGAAGAAPAPPPSAGAGAGAAAPVAAAAGVGSGVGSGAGVGTVSGAPAPALPFTSNAPVAPPAPPTLPAATPAAAAAAAAAVPRPVPHWASNLRATAPPHVPASHAMPPPPVPTHSRMAATADASDDLDMLGGGHGATPIAAHGW